MQDLIIGERYYIKHRDGIWTGEVTYLGIDNTGLIRVEDVEVSSNSPEFNIKSWWEKRGFKGGLGGRPEWWGFELVNISLENE